MYKPILSICIPTYNRSRYLKKTLDSIVNSDIFLNTNKIEIIISNNCSSDNTDMLCNEYANKYIGKIKYINQKDSIYPDHHIFKTLEYASGKYCKLNNDTCTINQNKLEKIIQLLEETNNDAVFFYNKKNGETGNITVNTFDDFIKTTSYEATWIGGFCIKKEVFSSLDNPCFCANLKLIQIDIYGKLFKNNCSVLIAKDNFFDVQVPNNKSGNYNVSEVFGKNYFTILYSYLNEHNGIFNETIEREKDIILEFINIYYFDNENEFSFEKNGYFKNMFKYFKNNRKFQLFYIKYAFQKFCKIFVNVEKTKTNKSVKLLNLIKFNIKRKNHNVKEVVIDSWKEKNKHNNTWLIKDFQSSRITVGNATYGPINAIFANDGREKLVIGNYCSIADGVKFIVDAEHSYDNLSTFPFKVFYFDYQYEATSKGDIIIKDDVWIAENAIILSGVTIGQGAIIGAGAVVTKDVPPYAIVGGNPAKIIKYRFEQNIIEKLLKIDYSQLTKEKINKLGLKLYTKITKENVDDLLMEIKA